jgi:hypothetical protein
MDVDFRTSKEISIVLRSNGLGPAILKSYSWVISDKEIAANSKENLCAIIEEIGLGAYNPDYYIPDINGYLEPDFKHYLLLVPGLLDASEHEKVRDLLGGIKVKVKYTSIYGEPFEKIIEV